MRLFEKNLIAIWQYDFTYILHNFCLSIISTNFNFNYNKDISRKTKTIRCNGIVVNIIWKIFSIQRNIYRIHTGLFTRGVFLNFFLQQPIVHIATIS
jgi:hypothetical protein